MTRAGNFDRQISVYRKSVTQNPANFNAEQIEWVPLVALPGSPVIAERFPAWVRDEMPSRSESVKQGLAVARNQTCIRLRWRNDIDSAMRITLHGDTDVVYQIIGGPAEIGGRKEMIELMCERYSTDGMGG